VCGEADDGLGTEDPSRQRHRGVVLSDMDTVGAHFECQVGPVVEDEGHAVRAAHLSRHTRPGQQRPRLEILVTQLDDVHTALDARAEEVGQVRAVRRAEVEAATREVPRGGHTPPRARAFMAFLVALTCCRLAASVMSATDRKVPSPP